VSGLPLREVVVGRNSKVWRTVAANREVAARFSVAISHVDIGRFAFTAADRVWVFSYSRNARENSQLFDVLAGAGVHEVVYVSSASAIVTRFTRCYEYPRVKKIAEDEARQRLRARILTLGLVVRSNAELPPGRNAATLEGAIESFLLAPNWPHEGGTSMRLFVPVDVPFTRRWEVVVYRFYGATQWALRRWPCVLRPFDVLLRALGIRWYGYVNLSNRLWTSTTL